MGIGSIGPSGFVLGFLLVPTLCVGMHTFVPHYRKRISPLILSFPSSRDCESIPESGKPRDKKGDNQMNRITVDIEQCGGRPCVRGMRILVTDVLDLYSAGLTASA